MSRNVPSTVDGAPDPRRVAAMISPAPAPDPYDVLLDVDPVLRGLSDRVGRPDPFRWNTGGRTGSSRFAGLVVHILSQQISTAVAFAMFDRIAAATGGVPDPTATAALGVDRLRSFGLSGAKARYIDALARMQLDGSLDIDGLDALDDAGVVAALTAAPGIGPWTADMFLIDQLHRPDVLPAGDLGIRHAVRNAWELSQVPSIDDVRRRGAEWSPYRTYAAALLWGSLSRA